MSDELSAIQFTWLVVGFFLLFWIACNWPRPK
jgi:hypothetical protein